MKEIAERYEQVKATIPAGVTLIAVSKTRTIEQIQAVYDQGHREFGENKAQELKEKAPALPNDITWHFIGHLQSNKVKQVVPHAHLIHSIDRMDLLHEVNKRAALLDKVQDVLLQVHIARESSKFGLVQGAVRDIIAASLVEHAHIRIRGLMGMATFTEDDGQIASEFSTLRDLYQDLNQEFKTELSQFNVLSMGMTGDANIALANGSNMVRIGTAIFGKRHY